MKTTKKNTAFTAFFMVAAVLLAKVCGMLRDILIAAMYGTQTAEAIAFSSASRIPVLFLSLFHAKDVQPWEKGQRRCPLSEVLSIVMRKFFHRHL